jgi:adenylate cyclase
MSARRILPLVFGLAIVLALCLLRAADPYPVRVARDTAFDFYQQLAPRPPGDYPVRVIDIDEASLAEIGQWPWTRDVLARLVDRLGEMGAAAIAVDLLFPEPDRLSPARIAQSLGVAGLGAGQLPDYDAQFAAALSRNPVVLGFSVADGSPPLTVPPKASIAISGTDPTDAVPPVMGAGLPLPALTEAATGLASVSLDPGESVGVIRQLPLLWQGGGRIYPTLSIEALRVAQQAGSLVVFGEPNTPYVEGVLVGGVSVPTTASGNLWLYYSTPDPALYLPAKDILGPDYANFVDKVAGQIVLIGTSAAGLLDIRGTPLGINVPGVAIHAQAIEQILSQQFLSRADWVGGLELIGLLVLGGVVVAAVLWTGPLLGMVATAGVAAVIAGLSWWLFREQGLLVDPSFPLFGVLTVYAAMAFFRFVISNADRRKFRTAFSHYVAPSLLSRIESNRHALKLGGELRQLSVMFSDIRSFTTISESLPPTQLVAMLNTLFGAMGTRITDNYGTIDKFIGDAIMAFWNAPLDVLDHARRSCLAALGMRQALAELNASDAFHLRRDGRPFGTIDMGIGISSGEALVGNLGLESRFDYSCIGDTVNVASRVEGACKPVGYDIVVAESTRAEAADLAFLEAGSVALKGKSSREPIHILVGDAETAQSAAFRALREAHGRALAELRAGRADGAMAEAAGLAMAVDPRLGHFYELLSGRREDFVDEVAQPTPVAATL